MSVVGGENATLAQTVLTGQAAIYAGSGTTQSTYIYPSATVAAWDSFIATAAPTASSFSLIPAPGSGSSGSAGATQTQASGASHVHVHWLWLGVPLLAVMLV